MSQLNTWVEQQLASSANPLVAFALLTFAGLLASLLPCVYPLYPITASIIGKRAAGSRKWPHPLAYFLGLCLVYAALGLVAAITGAALNHVLRLAEVNLLIAAVMALLALSTVGMIHLPIFHPRGDFKTGGLVGTLFLGCGAGLLSSACVGPVVVGLLINLAASSDGDISILTVARGTFQMFGFGAGVGLPFLVIGLFGVRLPKSGGWMIWFQYLLGALILYFAFVYLQKGMSIYGFSDDSILRLAGLMAALFACGYFFQSGEIRTDLRAIRSLASVGFVVFTSAVFAELVSPFANGSPQTNDIVAANMDPEGHTDTNYEVDGSLTWYLDEEAAYERAKRDGKNVFIDFYGSWCTNCKAFMELTRSDSDLEAALSQAVLLKIKDQSEAFRTYADDPRFPELKVGLPFFVITDPQGNLIYKTTDYLKTDEMALFLEN